MDKRRRPNWTQDTTGVPFECVARVIPTQQGFQRDLELYSHKISILKPGQAAAKPEDVYELSYCYDTTANNNDVYQRSVAPLVAKVLEGYNVNVIALGATGSGKSTLLEGLMGADPDNVTTEGDGIIHAAIDQIFDSIHKASIRVGETVARNRRAVTSKSYDFFVETSFVESHEEVVKDLYQHGNRSGQGLVIVEDAMHGWRVQGLRTQMAASAEEAKAHFNEGRTRHATQNTDIGNMQEHTLSVFAIAVSQYWPAQTAGEPDRMLHARVQFANAPGAERLAMEPEVLRIREGPTLNKSLLTFAAALRALQADRRVDGVDSGVSVMTRLLSDSLCGNCMSLIVGTLKQGDWESSEAVLRHLQVASMVHTYPVSNNNLIRGLLNNIRSRLLNLQAARLALQQQLDDAPADGSALGTAATALKVEALTEQNIRLREENAAMLQEKASLHERLKLVKKTVDEDQHELAALQGALIASEEQRLEVSRALVEFKLEHNKFMETAETIQYELQQKIIELEGRLTQGLVHHEEAAFLEAGRSEAQKDLAHMNKNLHNSHQHIAELMLRIKELEVAKHEMGQIAQEETHLLRERLRAEKHELQEQLVKEKKEEVAHLEEKIHVLEQAMGQDKQDVAKRLADAEEQLRRQEPMLKGAQSIDELMLQKQRQAAELASQLHETKAELDRMVKRKTVTDVHVSQIRDQYQKGLEQLADRVGQVAAGLKLLESDPESDTAPRARDLQDLFQQLLQQMATTQAEKERQLVQELDAAQSRLVEMTRNFRALHLGYRTLRYQVEDAVARGEGGSLPLSVVREDALLGNRSANDIIANEEDANRKVIASLRNRNLVLGMEAQHEKARDWTPPAFSRSRAQNLVPMGAAPRTKMLAPVQPSSNVAALMMENQRLQLEVEDARRCNTRAEGLRGSLASNHVLELERRAQQAENRALMAEEQLAQLNLYMSKATLAYQSEIMRLRKSLSRVEKTANDVKAK